MALSLPLLPGLGHWQSLADAGRRKLDGLTSAALKLLPERSYRVVDAEVAPVGVCAPPSTADLEAAELIVQNLLEVEIPYATLVMVSDATTDTPLAYGGALSGEQNPLNLAAHFGSLHRFVRQMAAVVTGPGEAVEELFVASSESSELLLPTAHGRWLLYVAVPSEKINPALLRSLLTCAGKTLNALTRPAA